MTNQNQAGVLQIRRMKNRTRFSVFQNLGFPSSLAALLAFPKVIQEIICNQSLQIIVYSILFRICIIQMEILSLNKLWAIM